MVQGSGASQREGRKITNVSIEIEGNVYCAPQAGQATTDVPPTIKIALVLDTQTNGAQLNSEDVFANPSGNAALASSCLRNMLYTKRFRVLKTLTISMPQVGVVAEGAADIEQAGAAMPFKIFRKLGFVTSFLANNGTIADITDNSLHLVAFANNTTMAPGLFYQARLRYRG